MTGLGALLVILAGAAAGMAAVCELRAGERAAADMLAFTSELRTAVCLRRMALPAAVCSLEERYPRYLRRAGETLARLREIPFAELWWALVRAMRLPPEPEKTVAALGRELAEGEEPTAAFARATAALREQQRFFREKQKEKGAVYLALGTGGGMLLALLLL